MDITLIVEALKTRAATLGGRVAGAAEFKRLEETANLIMPAAYVIPLDDNAEPQASPNSYSQVLRDSFAVIVVVSNAPDERGQTAVTSMHLQRKELFTALLGWEPDTEHGPIEYEGGSLLDMDRARLYYQFEFSAPAEITEEDTWRATRNAALPAFTEVKIDVDAIDPHDPNLGASGPDGKLESTITIAVPQ